MTSGKVSVTRDWRRCSGFTLIELMIVVLVLGVIVAFAYPAYTEFVERSRRSEATEALQNVATLQENFYNDNKEYSTSLGELGMPTTTANGYYTLDPPLPGAAVDGTIQSYTIRAQAQGGQASDTECATIQLDSNGNKTPADCW